MAYRDYPVLDGDGGVIIPQGRGNGQKTGHPGYVAGRWYLPFDAGVLAAGSALTTASIKFVPFFVGDTLKLTDLGVRITTLAAGGLIGCAIYENYPSANNRPQGNPLASVLGLSTAAAAMVSAAAAATLTAGMYWFGVQPDAVAGGVVCCQAYGPASSPAGWLTGSTNADRISDSAAGVRSILTVNNTYGSWPNLTGASFTDTTGSVTAIPYMKAG